MSLVHVDALGSARTQPIRADVRQGERRGQEGGRELVRMDASARPRGHARVCADAREGEGQGG
jgi:hypothetical protein